MTLCASFPLALISCSDLCRMSQYVALCSGLYVAPVEFESLHPRKWVGVNIMCTFVYSIKLTGHGLGIEIGPTKTTGTWPDLPCPPCSSWGLNIVLTERNNKDWEMYLIRESP